MTAWGEDHRIKQPSREWQDRVMEGVNRKHFKPTKRLRVKCVVCEKYDCDSDDCWSIVLTGRPLLKESHINATAQRLYKR